MCSCNDKRSKQTLRKYFRKELYKLKAYTPGIQPNPEDKIIKLNTNENPYPPSPTIRKEIDRIIKNQLLKRYPNPNSKDLRKEIARHYKLQESQILVTNGSDEGLALLFKGVLGKNSTVVMPYPTYSLYPVLADIQMNSVNIKKIPLLQNLHFDFLNLQKSKGELLTFAHPNAPTGILEEKEKLINLIKNFSGVVLSDEAYIDFSPFGSSLISEINNHENLIVSRTYSKSYSLTGIRVGYLAGNENSIRLLEKLKDSYNVGMLEQYIALAAQIDQKYFLQNRKKVIIEREKVRAKLIELGFEIPKSDTNFLFAKPPKGLSAKEIFDSLTKSGILIRYFSDGISKDYIRITIGTERENKIVTNTISSLITNSFTKN
ncbi:MAG: histidinol-phosphate transaminase [Leptospiraceae bacterium]|nr:histidinol-phosphate transaminase [Leptospiraceae bacterium]